MKDIINSEINSEIKKDQTKNDNQKKTSFRALLYHRDLRQYRAL